MILTLANGSRNKDYENAIEVSSSGTTNNTNYKYYPVSPGSVKGASYFDYYVNGAHAHSSTDWWNFDFR